MDLRVYLPLTFPLSLRFPIVVLHCWGKKEKTSCVDMEGAEGDSHCDPQVCVQETFDMGDGSQGRGQPTQLLPQESRAFRMCVTVPGALSHKNHEE